MRLTRLVVTGVLVAAGLGVALGQTPSVTFLGMDTTTLGSWKGVYGQDGQYLPDFQFSVPPYSGLNPIEDNQRLLDIWSCFATPCDPRQLLKIQYSYDPNERVKSYFYNRDYADFQVNTTDGQTHRIALYFCDYEFYGRSITVTARNSNTGATLDTRTLASYSGGVYFVYNYTGNVDFWISDNFPLTDLIPNATVSGFFWGGSGGPPTATPAAPVVGFNPTGPTAGSVVSGNVSLQATLDSMPGVTTVQYYLDNSPLGSPLSFFITDILADPVALPFNYTWNSAAVADGQHTITAKATDANGVSTMSAGLKLTTSNGVANPNPVLIVSTNTLNFAGTAGGTNPTPQPLGISNGGSGTLSWSTGTDASWLSVSPSSGTGAANPNVMVNIAGLSGGSYTGHITVTAAGATGSPATVTVNLNLASPTPVLSVMPGSLTFNATVGGGNPATQPISISNSGSGTLSWSTTTDASWLSVSPASGTGAANPNVSTSLAGLSQGSYTGHVTVTAAGASGSPAKVTVYLNVNLAGSGPTYIYVSDPNNRRVQQFTAAGTWSSSFTQNLVYPVNVATDGAGNVYVADAAVGAILKYSSSGALLATIGSGTLASPTGVALDTSGNIYAGDTANGRVVEFSPAGSVINTFTGLFTSGGYLAVAVDAAGNVYADDYYNSRLKKFANNGTLLLTFGAGYWQAYPGDIQIDGSGNIWVGDPYAGGVQEFSSSGTHLASVTGPGGYFAIDGSGNFWGTCGYTFCEFSSSGALILSGGNPTGGQFGNGYGSCNGCMEGISGMAANPAARP
ncbi:MAG TPA: Ig-like domain-containing protein [Bryobacteraceae bacterium]|nr:Ig-like domain-containing protein [Bryobacteraceae bacterium]